MTAAKRKGKSSGKGANRGNDNAIKTRKEIRKDKRKAKRMKRHEFFSKKNNAPGKFVRQNTSKSNDLNSKSPKTVLNEAGSKIQPKSSDGFIKHQIREKEKEHLRRKKLENDMKKTRRNQLKQANHEEDRVIKKLEKQLKLNKRKSKNVPKSFSSDGLDYLLEVCDQDKIKQAVLLEQNMHESGSEFEEDFAMVTGRGKKPKVIASGEESDDDGDDIVTGDGGDDDDSAISAGEELSDGDDLDEADSELNDSAMSEQFELEESDVAHRQIRTKESSSKTTKSSQTSESGQAKQKRKSSNSSDMFVPNEKCAKNNTFSDGGLYVRLRPAQDKENKSKDNTCEAEMDSASENLDCQMGDSDGSEEDAEDPSENTSMNNGLWEDIYGRTRDKKGNVVQVSAGKYVPPQLRAQATSSDAKKQEQLQRLCKQMKGLLNRLAENNMNSIAMQLDELYMSNSRNDMNDTLTKLMLESLVTPVLTPERLIMEHCMLIAILHANVGTEVGAHFLQVMVKQFSELHNEDCEIENKKLDNVVLVISHLYNFKVFNSLLMYNILDKLADTFGPKEVELILLILRSVGFSLRKDDPIALKNLVLQLQQKASNASHAQSDSRVQFMLDILLAIKNNNMAKIPNYDTSHSEHLKKLLKGFLRKGNYITEMKISLEDLLKAEERGRWWVVGSAWSGVLPGESQSGDKVGTLVKPALQSQNYSQQLLDLARKQRMNTDVRRNIFCIIMTAEDYLDAFEKLLHMGLKNQQEREIIHVIIDCCLQEKEFNPYYGHLTQKFCDFDRKYQMILQYSMWDKFKEVHNLSTLQVRNLARYLVVLFIEKGLPISVLKVIHFAEVDKAMVRLLRQILLGILLHESLESMQEVFERVAMAPKLHMFRESIRLFIRHFLLRKTDSLPPEDVETLKERANIVDTILSVAESRSRLF